MGGGTGRLVEADPEYAYETLNKSTSTLGVDYVDLCYLYRVHRAGPTPHGADRTHYRWDNQARQVSAYFSLDS
jgi:aryl-alcohol dehydrogenase-like predicted oxidoreductase